MNFYINASSCISPQNSFEEKLFLNPITEYKGVYMKSIEPDYKSYIDPKSSRRMGRIIKMGVTAANDCLTKAGITNPDAIITGTGFGCLEDTTKFLLGIIDNDEQLLTPTSFIQSTHNTISAQIALLLSCHNYNFTYVHRSFSFESSVIDAIMLMEEGAARNVLVGGLDEISDEFYTMGTRTGQWKTGITNNLEMLNTHTSGAIAGEGASFFLLSNEKTEQTNSKITAISLFYNASEQQGVQERIIAFLKEQKINISDLDLILLGNNGNVNDDLIYTQLQKNYFINNHLAYFKHLCGEYFTASGFALWLADKIIKEQHVPEEIKLNKFGSVPVRNILIYNHTGKNHSLILVSQC